MRVNFRRRAFILLTTIVFAVLVRPVLAQQFTNSDQPTGVDGPPLSLQNAIDEALDKNPELIALRKQFEVSRFHPAQERYLAPPTFDAQIWQWPIDSLNPLNTNMYMFMFNQDLPGRGKRTVRAAAADVDVAMTDNEIAVRARQLVDDVKRAYAELFVARRAIAIYSDNLTLLRQLADVSHVKYSTGRISQQDVLKPVVELSQIHDEIITFGERRDLAAARLNTLLDRSPDGPIGPLTEPRDQVELPTAEELQRIASTSQPELKGAHLAVQKAQADLAVAKQEYKPDFSVQAGYMLTPRSTDAVMARVGVSWPNAPWARGRIAARVGEATAAIDAADATRKATANRVRLALHEAYIRVQVAQRHASLLRTTIVPQAQQTLDVARVAYQTDRVDFLSLIDNQRVLLAAQLAYVRALSDIEQALADLERAVGSDLPSGTAAEGRR
ncbi:MAG: TolC family protein [Acidobacteriota bacterium]